MNGIQTRAKLGTGEKRNQLSRNIGWAVGHRDVSFQNLPDQTLEPVCGFKVVKLSLRHEPRQTVVIVTIQ